MTTKETSSSLTEVSRPIGEGVNLNRTCGIQYTTGNGTRVDKKVLSGTIPVFFPTGVPENTVFEYIFSVKDLIQPSELPTITEIYFKNIVVKFQDMFTQVVQGSVYNDNCKITYAPFQADLCQDPDGVITTDAKYNGKDVKLISSENLTVKRSSPLYAVSTNLKFDKALNVTTNDDDYKLIFVYNEYDENGKFVRKVMKSKNKCTPEEYKQVFDPEGTASFKNGLYCIDIILCDIFVYVQADPSIYAPGKIPITDLTRETVSKTASRREKPIGWLSRNELINKYGKIGVKADYSDSNRIPGDMYVHIDMTAKSKEIFSKAYMNTDVFCDNGGVILPYTGQYTVAYMLMSADVLSN